MKKTFPFILILFLLCQCSSQDSTKQKSEASTVDQEIEAKVEALLGKMSLQEKIGQTAQRGTSSREKTLSEDLKKAVREGRVGAMLNVMNESYVAELQKIAIEESPNGIPLIFARDVIHGFKTIFPIPLAQAATWNPELVRQGARVAAVEASSVGIRWTFAPMLDISRDPRWGRIAESAGEDPYLTSVLAKSYIKGFQGDDLANGTSLAACGKHFVGYGAAEGGRDYNTAIIHDQLLHNVYLKPFKVANDAGVATFMTSFNELNGIPASANKYILKDILRDKWGFEGFVISDWDSVIEMIAHGYSKDEKAAAEAAANAGLDMEMTSTTMEDHLEALVAEGKVSMQQLDEMVKNVLRTKFRMGLFEQPYYEKGKDVLYADEHLAASKETAIQSMVLLKNDKKTLPLSQSARIALIGPLADAPREQLGTWTFDGEKEHSVTPLTSLRNQLGNQLRYSAGLTYSRDKTDKGFKEAVKAARKSDVIVFVGGEEAILSGEAHSRANINLPGAQEELISELAKTGKPIVLIVMAGRPITLNNVLDKVDAVLYAWHPGTMAGPALTDLLMGVTSPSGRLPVTWPKSVGQIPIYYNHKNTGRPASADSYVHIDDIPIGAWQSSLGNNSHYLDDGYEPMYPFGYGLSYSSFSYEGLQQSTETLQQGETIAVSAKITNTGTAKASEVVQLYFRDEFGSITRPVRELLRFERITLEPGQSQEVQFTFSTDDLQFYDATGNWTTEPGTFKFWIAPHAAAGLEGSFEVK